jgi:hypothetical protein
MPGEQREFQAKLKSEAELWADVHHSIAELSKLSVRRLPATPPAKGIGRNDAHRPIPGLRS